MFLTLPLLLSVALLLSGQTLSHLSSTGSTVLLNGISYYVSPDSLANVDLSSVPPATTNGKLVPITVVHSPNNISAIIDSYYAEDDVFQAGFLQVVYITSTTNSTSQLKSSGPYSDAASNYTTVSGSASLPKGPYFVDPVNGETYRAYRLYSDAQGAFTETVIESLAGAYAVLPANLPGQNLAVAVPSRLYHTKSATKPLAGVRLGVKDIYDVAGLRTGDGNRAWYRFYPPANASAVSIQRLIDAGAVIVGKMKTSQFANGESATTDWVDYHEPFNPRGDGYQDTSSSSAGPGAGEAAYSWLDITIGSDTGGSIRGPSDAQGLFGNRPTHGLVPLTGVMPLSPVLDTAGFIVRDPYLWETAAQVLYGGLKTYEQFPKEILTVQFPANDADPTYSSPQADRIILEFLSKMKNFLNATVTSLDIEASFRKTGPANSPSRDVIELLNITYPILIGQQQSLLVRDPFYKAYAAKYGGRRPFIDPVPLVRWGFADSYPPSATTEAIANMTIFRNWFNTNILIANPSSATCSDKILLYVGADGSQAYRNQYFPPETAPYGYGVGRVATYTGAPDFVVPIGQAKYHSNITLHEEVLPVTLDFMVARGCDGMLFKLIQRLVEASLVDIPKTGRTLEDGGEILFRRSMEVSGSRFQ